MRREGACRSALAWLLRQYEYYLPSRPKRAKRDYQHAQLYGRCYSTEKPEGTYWWDIWRGATAAVTRRGKQRARVTGHPSFPLPGKKGDPLGTIHWLPRIKNVF